MELLLENNKVFENFTAIVCAFQHKSITVHTSTLYLQQYVSGCTNRSKRPDLGISGLQVAGDSGSGKKSELLNLK